VIEMNINQGNHLERYAKKVIEELLTGKEISKQEANFIKEYIKNIY